MARFQPGSGGRPKGVRNKLSKAFLDELHADFAEYGAAAIRMVRIEDPVSYIKIVASTLPRDLDIQVSAINELSDEDLDLMIQKLRAQIEEERQTIDVTPKPRAMIDGRH